jgi:glycosyltransferase involved in cell wall biosynthesis
MKLLFLDQYSDPGGGQLMGLEVLDAVRRQGWGAVVALPGDGPLFRRVQALGFEAVRLDCRTGGPGFAADTPKVASQIRTLAGGADLVYINGPRLLPAAALARIAQPVLHHAYIEVTPLAARWLAGASLATLDAQAIACCEMVANTWRPFGKPVSVIYNGVRGPAGVPARSRLARIGCIGRISPEKGQLEFLRAAPRIRQAVADARFVIAGAALFGNRVGQGYERRVRDAAAGLPVEFTGWVDDVYPVMRDLDLLLMPAVWREPNPRVILEAFAAGLPVIAFRAGGIPEIIHHGINGFLCDSVEEMAELAIELLRGDRIRLREVSQAARESWESHFTVERFQREVVRAIEGAAGGASGSHC